MMSSGAQPPPGLLEALPAIFWTTDGDLNLTGLWGGAAFRAGLVPESLLGRPVARCFEGQWVQAAHEAARRGETASFLLVLPIGLFRAVVEGTPSGCSGTALDLRDPGPPDSPSASAPPLGALAETLAAAVFIVQGDRYIYVNRTFQLLTRCSREELLRMPFWEVVHPDSRELVRERGRARLRGEEVPDRYEALLAPRGGEPIWLDVRATRVVLDGQPAILATGLDVTEQRRAVEALKASETRYRTLFERNLAGVYRKSLQGRVLAGNEAFAQMLGYAREELLSHTFVDFYADPAERRAFLLRLQVERSVTSYEIRLKRRDGSVFASLQNATLVEDGAPGSPYVEGTVLDISERKRLEESMSRRAYHDVLTGLPNRALFLDRVRHAISYTQRSGRGLAVLFLDLDGFKPVNDSFGHDMGDELLRQVADRLSDAVREGDTVARFGGDEFTLLLPDVGRAEEASRIAEKVVAMIGKPYRCHGREVSVTASVGVALHPTDGADVDSLVRNADRAMYRAKESGRGTYRLASMAPVLTRPAGHRSLLNALQLNELALVFEPSVDSASGDVRGAEAHVRWRHPDGKVVPLAEFLPMAEETELIIPIETWALWSAARQVRAFRVAAERDTVVSLGVSGTMLKNGPLVPLLDRILARTGAVPSALELLLTDRACDRVGAPLASLARSVRQRGVRVALDAFWPGTSSLEALRTLPLDGVRIDVSLLGDLSGKREETNPLRSVVQEARRRGLRVTGIGVATPAQRSAAAAAGCDELSGPAIHPIVEATWLPSPRAVGPATGGARP